MRWRKWKVYAFESVKDNRPPPYSFFVFLTDLEFLLNTQRRKVDSIKNTMWQTGLRNNNLSLTLNSFSKNDTQEFLARTIDAANRVTEQMREIRRNAISITGSDIYKLKLKMASLEPQWAVKFGLAEENGMRCLCARLCFFMNLT